MANSASKALESIADGRDCFVNEHLHSGNQQENVQGNLQLALERCKTNGEDR